MVTKYVSVKDTAVEMRKALKAAFPGVKFSVRGHSYAGGASINVSYVDGPDKREVEAVAKYFEGATFDGMIDLKEYRSVVVNGEEVHWGSDFVFVNREFSAEAKAEAEAFVDAALYADYPNVNKNAYYEVPDAFFGRASLANGGLTQFGGYGFRYEQHHYQGLVELAAKWFCNEAWFDAHEGAMV